MSLRPMEAHPVHSGKQGPRCSAVQDEGNRWEKLGSQDMVSRFMSPGSLGSSLGRSLPKPMLPSVRKASGLDTPSPSPHLTSFKDVMPASLWPPPPTLSPSLPLTERRKTVCHVFPMNGWRKWMSAPKKCEAHTLTLQHTHPPVPLSVAFCTANSSGTPLYCVHHTMAGPCSASSPPPPLLCISHWSAYHTSV